MKLSCALNHICNVNRKTEVCEGSLSLHLLSRRSHSQHERRVPVLCTLGCALTICALLASFCSAQHPAWKSASLLLKKSVGDEVHNRKLSTVRKGTEKRKGKGKGKGKAKGKEKGKVKKKQKTRPKEEEEEEEEEEQQEEEDPNFWDDRYRKDTKPEEWHDDYDGLHKLLKSVTWENKDARILHVGCGNSRLMEGFYDEGYESITNIDTSEFVIEQMRKRNANRTSMTWEVMDATKMDSFKDESFDVVVDKALLDTFAEFKMKGVMLTVATYLKEVQRVLKPGGYLLCVSYGMLTWKLLDGFPHLEFEAHWMPMPPKFNVRSHVTYISVKSAMPLGKAEKWPEVLQSLTSCSEKESCLKALSWNPTMAFAWSHLGSFDSGGDVDGQRYSPTECYQKALSLVPQDATAWNNLGSLGGGEVGGISYSKKTCYEVGLYWFPEEAWVWFELGQLGGGEVDEQKYSEKQCYQKVLSLLPQDATAWSSLGRMGGGEVDGTKYSKNECHKKASSLDLPQFKIEVRSKKTPS